MPISEIKETNRPKFVLQMFIHLRGTDETFQVLKLGEDMKVKNFNYQLGEGYVGWKGWKISSSKVLCFLQLFLQTILFGENSISMHES